MAEGYILIHPFISLGDNNLMLINGEHICLYDFPPDSVRIPTMPTF